MAENERKYGGFTRIGFYMVHILFNQTFYCIRRSSAGIVEHVFVIQVADELRI